MSKIMVVDDEEDIIFVVESLLKEEGYDTVSCTSGEECLERIVDENPELVLMDIMMPGLDGWATTERIKANPKTKDIPVAMLTVRADRGDKIRSFQRSRCDAYIVKPIDREELLKVTNFLLKK